MISFKTYILKNKLPNKLKNLQTGDKVRYIGKCPFYIEGRPLIKDNEICTFLRWEEFDDRLYIKVMEYKISIHPKNIIKD